MRGIERTARWSFGLATRVGIALVLVALPIQAATITVNSTADCTAVAPAARALRRGLPLPAGSHSGGHGSGRYRASGG